MSYARWTVSKVNILGFIHTFQGQRCGPEGYPVYQEQAQNQLGVHTPVSGCTGFPGALGRSEAGDLCTETWKGEPFRELRDHGKLKHKAKLTELRKMPAPNLKGI